MSARTLQPAAEHVRNVLWAHACRNIKVRKHNNHNTKHTTRKHRRGRKYVHTNLVRRRCCGVAELFTLALTSILLLAHTRAQTMRCAMVVVVAAAVSRLEIFTSENADSGRNDETSNETSDALECSKTNDEIGAGRLCTR